MWLGRRFGRFRGSVWRFGPWWLGRRFGCGGLLDCYRCQAKASSCGAPADIAASECVQLCGQNLTESQLSCLEGADCSELLTGDPCNLGGGATGGTGGTVGTGGTEGTTGQKSLGESCDCAGTGEWVTCSGTNSECEPSLTCVEFADRKICTQECIFNPDEDDPCGAGLKCSDLIWGSAEMGTFCW